MAKLNDFQKMENVFIYINRIASYINEVTEKTLFKDSKTVDAVTYCILQFGKNIANISEDFKNRHAEISKLDWAKMAMFKMDGYFMDEELWEVLDDEDMGILKYYSNIETIYLKERQKPENKSISLIPAKFLKRDNDAKLPLKNNSKEYPRIKTLANKTKGFNPRNHITTHSSIWTVKKK